MATERVTIVDVATRAGVAISSVSSALNNRPGVSEATRARILKAADDLGFVPSLRGRSLSGKRAYAVGFVVHRDPDVLELDPFFGGFMGGIEAYIDRQGYALVLQTSAGEQQYEDRYRRLAADRRVDGVFLSELRVDDPRVPLVQELALPAVGVNADSGFPVPVVRQGHEAGIRDLIEHLVGAGHRRIGYVGGPGVFVHSRQRELAWRTTIETAGLVPGPTADGRFTYEGGIDAANSLLIGNARPTAVLCANDLSAMGFISQAQHLGLDVPGDISVAGYDGIQLGAYSRPSLTTIQTSPRAIGAEAARMLLDVISGDEVADVDIAPAELVIRDSTGPAPVGRK